MSFIRIDNSFLLLNSLVFPFLLTKKFNDKWCECILYCCLSLNLFIYFMTAAVFHLLFAAEVAKSLSN